MKVVYPAIFRAEKVGWFIEFPDVENALTQSDDLLEGLELAKDALEGMLVERQEAGLDFPPATPIWQLKVSSPDFATLICADIDEWKAKNARF